MEKESTADERFFGCHVSASGGLHNALKNAEALKINTIQIHASPPQRWNSKPFAPGIESEFNDKIKTSGVKRVFFHGIYLINLATANPNQLNLAKLSLLHDLDLSARIGGAGVIFHCGSNKDQPDERSGFKQAAEAINWIMDESKNEARLILEIAAGSGQVIGDRMEELAEIYSGVEAKERVGFGLDTQHLWASGYDLRDNLEQVVNDAESILGLDKIWAIHLNDSKTELGSRKDRHENLGDGLIGWDGIKGVFTHPKLVEIPFILETPAMKDLETAKTEVEKLHRMLKE